MTDHHRAVAEVAEIDRAINAIGGAMLFAEPVTKAGFAVGVSDSSVFYGGGRGGVLGAVPWQQAQSAFAFFPPEVVRSTWAKVLDWGDPLTMACHYAAGLVAFGRATFDEAAAGTVVEIGELVSASVVPMGLPLFVGWRSMARRGDAAGDAALCVMTLRELRGDVHVQDVAAIGLHPLEAQLVAHGTEGAALHGWQPPYPDAAPHVAALRAASGRTSERMASMYRSALTARQWSEFADAVAHLSRTVHYENQGTHRSSSSSSTVAESASESPA